MPTLVTDFDGTLARQDFYTLVLQHLMPPGAPNYYAEYLDGTMTHFECLASYFGAIPSTEAELLAVVGLMELEPELPTLLGRLGAGGWDVVVASAGCGWYIEKLLAAADVVLPVHANLGRWRGDGLGLEMTRPTASPFFSASVGIDKAAVVRDAVRRSGVVAFAGDGLTDVPAALLVPPELRFAKHDCATELRARGEEFVWFHTWADVVDALVD